MGFLKVAFGTSAAAGAIAMFLSQAPSENSKLDTVSNFIKDTLSELVSPTALRDAVIVRPVDLAAPSLKKFMYLDFKYATDKFVGHADFCARVPDECMATSSSGMMIDMTDSLKKRIENINLDVNKRIKPADDNIKYAQFKKNPDDKFVDYWNIPDDMEGDCEDYALTKRKELRAIGIPDTAMSLVFVKAHRYGGQNAEGHAVLSIRTDKGDFILDNLTNEMLLPLQTGHEFVSATSMKNTAQWQTATAIALTREDIEAETAASGGSEMEALIKNNIAPEPLVVTVGTPVKEDAAPTVSTKAEYQLAPLPPRRPKGLGKENKTARKRAVFKWI